MAARQVRPPASWSWLFQRKDVTVPPSRLSPGSPTSELDPWSTAAVQDRNLLLPQLILIHVWFTETVEEFFRTYRRAQFLHLLAELFTIFLLFCQNPPLHLWGFGMFSSRPERRLTGGHLINQTAEAPPVGTQSVMFVADHLRSWTEDANLKNLLVIFPISLLLCITYDHIWLFSHVN